MNTILKQNIKGVILVLILLTIALVYVLWPTPAPTLSKRQERTWKVTAQKVGLKTIQPDIVAYGSIEALNKITLRTKAAGYITKIAPHIEDGQPVKKGQLIAIVDPSSSRTAFSKSQNTTASAQATLNNAKASLNTAQQKLSQSQQQLNLKNMAYNRQKQLRAKGIASKAGLEKAESDQLSAKANFSTQKEEVTRIKSQIKQSTAGLSTAQQAQKQAKKDLSETEIIAPFDGILSSVNINLSQYVSAQSDLATLYKSTPLQIRIALPIDVYMRLKKANDTPIIGQSITFFWTSGEQVLKGEARIARISPLIETKSATIDIFARTSKTSIPVGAFVKVVLKDKAYKNTFEVPKDAVYYDQYIYTIDPKENRLKAHNVTVLRQLTKTDIIKVDIPNGSLILTSYFPEAGTGIKVRYAQSQESSSSTSPKKLRGKK